MKIKDLPDSSKPRERFLKHGPEALSDAELFAIILRTGLVGENVMEMSNRLISKFGLNLFEKELKGWYVARGRNEFKFLGPCYMPIYAKIMEELGIDYKIVGDDVKITNAEKFLKYMSKKTGKKVGIFTESKVEKTTSSEAKALKKFVSGTIYGFEVVRANRAKEIATCIDSVKKGKEIKKGDSKKLDWLYKEYKRFTHKDYKRSNS